MPAGLAGDFDFTLSEGGDEDAQHGWVKLPNAEVWGDAPTGAASRTTAGLEG